jgi:hypothetical protein
MRRGADGAVNAHEKRIMELSIVKKGARDGCRIEMQQQQRAKACTSKLS